jgi:hypothetical protein
VDARRNTLRVFCEGSGQKINLEKSSVFFDHHCPDHVKEGVKARSEVQSEVLINFYHGMSTSVGWLIAPNFDTFYRRFSIRYHLVSLIFYLSTNAKPQISETLL